MFRKVVSPVLIVCLAASSTLAAESLPPANQWVPANAVLVVELDRPEAVLDAVDNPQVTDTVTSHPAYQAVSAQPGFQQFTGVVRYLESMLDTDWKTGLRKLVGGGMTLSVCPDGATLLTVDAKDGKMLAQLHKIILGFAKSDAEKKGQQNPVVSETYRSVETWALGSGGVYAIVGNRFLVANRRSSLQAALDLRADTSATRLASSPAYQAARRAAGKDATATVYVNLKVLKHAPGIQEALNGPLNPAVAFLFPGITDAVRSSDWLAAGLQVNGNAISLKAVVDGAVPRESKVASFASFAEPGAGAFPNLAVPRRIAAVTLYRDLHGFYAAKDDLFPERTSGIIFFENMMGIFFTGRDLTEEVLAETEPDVRLVVAEQNYDPAVGVPKLKIPAFAAIFRLKNPKTFGLVLEEAWQKALGLINFTRGQQALPGLIIDRPVHGDTKFTLAYFSAAAQQGVGADDSSFNFRPSLVLVDDFAILSSSDGLAKDLIDALKREKADSVKPLAQTHSAVEVDGTALASILRANRANMVRQNMLEKGHTQKQAEGETDMLLTIVEHVGQVQFEVGAPNGQLQVDLKLKVQRPQ